MSAWWEGLTAILNASKARPVPSAMAAEQKERIERRRLGLLRPINGTSVKT
jgi:hypothetical protein